jgi:hypothetical protein
VRRTVIHIGRGEASTFDVRAVMGMCLSRLGMTRH